MEELKFLNPLEELRRATTLLCETRGHEGKRPCDFCSMQTRLTQCERQNIRIPDLAKIREKIEEKLKNTQHLLDAKKKFKKDFVAQLEIRKEECLYFLNLIEGKEQ